VTSGNELSGRSMCNRGRKTVRDGSGRRKLTVPGDPCLIVSFRMSTKTQTLTTHYHIQKSAAPSFSRVAQLSPERDSRGGRDARADGAWLRTGVYMGWDGDRPTRCLDAWCTRSIREPHHHPPSLLGRGPLHGRGSGWTEVDGVPLRLEGLGRDPHPGLELAPPRQRRRPPGRFMNYSSEPTLWTLGIALSRTPRREPSPRFRRVHNSPAAPRRRDAVLPASPPPRARDKEAPRGPHPQPYDEQEILATPRGTRTKFLTTARSATRPRPHAGDDPVAPAKTQSPERAAPGARLALRGRGSVTASSARA